MMQKIINFLSPSFRFSAPGQYTPNDSNGAVRVVEGDIWLVDIASSFYGQLNDDKTTIMSPIFGHIIEVKNTGLISQDCMTEFISEVVTTTGNI